MPNSRLQPFTHWLQPTFLLQIYPTTPSQPQGSTTPPFTSQTNQSALLCTSTLVPNSPAPPHRQASSAPSASSPNTMPSITHRHQYIHPLPPTNHHLHPPTLLTLEHPSSMQTARMGLTTCGILASLPSYTTPIITHRTSKTHGAVTSNTMTAQTFFHLQAYTIQAITNAYALSINSTPFWWLLFHLDMLVLAPSTTTKCFCCHTRSHQFHLLWRH